TILIGIRLDARTMAGAQSSEAVAATRKFRRSIRGEVVGTSASWCIITPSATEILRDLQKPQVRQGRPCGDSSRTRTHSGKPTTWGCGPGAGNPQPMRWRCGLLAGD